jgi:hypothetical protein
VCSPKETLLPYISLHFWRFPPHSLSKIFHFPNIFPKITCKV